jgi:hypothetical protein
MQLVHYSAEPLKEVYSVPPEKQLVWKKPQGLWFSTNAKGGWKDFCHMSPGLRQNNYKTNIKLGNAKILHVTGKQGLAAFDRKYGVNAPDTWERRQIDWPKIAKEYDGIYFPVYYPELRDKYRWYYSWDCSSGCIWNIDPLIPTESVPVKKSKEELKEAA